MDKPKKEEFQIFEEHKKERFGKFHKFHCDRDGYCHCEICKKIKGYLEENKTKNEG